MSSAIRDRPGGVPWSPECYNPPVVEQLPTGEPEDPAGSVEQLPTGEPEDPAGSVDSPSASQPLEADSSQTKSNQDSRYLRIRRSHFYMALMPLAFAAGLAYGYLLWGRNAEQPQSAQGSPVAEITRMQVGVDDDPSLGPSDAPVTIVEFSDFNCPYCRAWHQQVLGPLLEAYPDQIRFVYRDFPVVGGGATGLAAARAANCAAEQGGYWGFHDAMFSGSFSLNADGFRTAATELGLDPGALDECLEAGRGADEPQADLREGASLGVTGTPTFFINGIPLVGAQPLSRFAQIIEAELGQ